MEHKPYSQQVAEMNREREGRMLETPDWDEDGHIAPEVGKYLIQRKYRLVM